MGDPTIQTKLQPTTVSLDRTSTPALSAAQQQLTDQATAAVIDATLHPNDVVKRDLVEKLSQATGFALGLLVTEGLALSKKWNAPVLDASGQPVPSVDTGTPYQTDRVGNADIRERHKAVAGPKIAALAAKMNEGEAKKALTALADGATEAPGFAYRGRAKIDNAIAHLKHDKHKDSFK